MTRIDYPYFARAMAGCFYGDWLREWSGFDFEQRQIWDNPCGIVWC